MKTIAVRKHENKNASENFQVTKLDGLLASQAMKEKLDYHDFYFMLIIKNGSGVHNIDFTTYSIRHHSLFFIETSTIS